MKRILIQLDTDPLASVFDRVVAVDAGVDELFSYGSVSPEAAVGLTHGAIFTRKVADLKSTAIFVGGSDVQAGEAVYAKVLHSFFGPMRVSVMLDSNGSNTTAAAAVASAGKHLVLKETQAVILGGTGPVGFRAAQLLASQGATVKLVSRHAAKASKACVQLKLLELPGTVTPHVSTSFEETIALCEGADLLIAAGAAGIELASLKELTGTGIRVVVDVNAVPPLGIRGVESTDKAKEREGMICYGALGVGNLKIKVHKAAIEKLFTSNDLTLDTQAMLEIAQEIIAAT
ncbi:NAD(P)-dependent methylenetetrahydromethanopterin dehydrogenase [Planctopirus hydrillae]|uniref:MtdA bifunctional protein n=1 Tax=Planctopirus hydrillae TaxID=1841610 RepID=A0A1C3EJH2_9PLAN|nr:NAD(P)-dependent methylenetetrahydromethanopterin dehydrogenase [Planctopirus hydrillae]ODA33378.1 MtdA bifunctional protein [Planctopirus hydrillae]